MILRFFAIFIGFFCYYLEDDVPQLPFCLRTQGALLEDRTFHSLVEHAEAGSVASAVMLNYL